MSDRQREILQRVADGELSPEEADRLLRGAPETDEPARTIDRVRIAVGVGRVDVVGDVSVREAEVDGPHRLDIDGGTLVVHGELDTSEGFSFDRGERHRRAGVRAARHGVRPRDIRDVFSKHGAALVVRMNPSLELDVELDAGPLTISGLTGPIRARLSAGPITIDGFSGPLDVGVNAGAVRATGVITKGESRVRNDAGAVRIRLDPASSVHVVAHAALGKVVVPGSPGGDRRRFSGDRREATIGAGEATLRIETAMGSVHVSV